LLSYTRDHSIIGNVYMTKAVFFDLYYTLIRYDPSREELLKQLLEGYGMEASLEAIRQGLSVADDFFYREQSRLPLSRRPAEERITIYIQHQEITLKEAGIHTSKQLTSELLGKMRQLDLKLALYDDVIPALTELKERGLILGSISNVDKDISPVFEELGIYKLLQIVVTSLETGFGKPEPEIFQEALRRAKVAAPEAIFIGDQYQIDVVGANRAGMKGVLLDRNNGFKEIVDCPRIQSLSEIVSLL